jgi:uncharacterized LabA/DUF88 family protein
MTQDQHDPTATTPGSTEGTANTGAQENTPSKTSSRPPRRRHTSSRGRQAKEQKEQQELREQHGEQPAAPITEPVAEPAAASAPVAETAAHSAPIAPVATEVAAETTKRPPTRGRRGGSNRRRGGKPESQDVQLIPVISATETPAHATSEENPPAIPLPAPEPLPLDAAILAHLDALEGAMQQSVQSSHATQPQTEEQPSTEATPAPGEEPTQQRRYRFDRPRVQATATQTPVRTERLSGWRATPPTLMTTPVTAVTEATSGPEETQPSATTEPGEFAETFEGAEATEPVGTVESPEHAEPEIAVITPESTDIADTSGAPEAPEDHETAIVDAEPVSDTSPATEEAAEHEEQAEREGAARRRRRGRGRGRSRTQDAESGEVEGDEQHGQNESRSPRLPVPYAAPETAVSYATEYDQSNGYLSGAEGADFLEEPGYSPYTPAPRTRGTRQPAPAARQQESRWSMASAQQHVQEPASPFSAPEPSFARGFGPQSSGVASPLHEPLPRVRRNERGGDAPPMSSNQLGAVLTNSIAQQTDRLLNELRRQQYPPSMTVALPAFPSTERIGVFVDVANLLYSARNQRMSIDFGRLLDFLRGNRRLIRAHAYAPTNPDPHAEQTFLSAVKGVGYRITTKNYKTFASGARKADMDLDLCMDIVRLVDAGALDTVVLVSGDSDFLPLLEYCSDHGVRVEVAAFEDAAAMILRQSCDLFINLSQVDEIRA